MVCNTCGKAAAFLAAADWLRLDMVHASEPFPAMHFDTWECLETMLVKRKAEMNGQAADVAKGE